jgi:CHASE2 domain-containing sensor protein
MSFRRYIFNLKVYKGLFFIGLVMSLIGLSGLGNFGEFLDPIGQAVKDFELTDIVFSHLREESDSKLESRVVVVNFGQADRATMARMLRKINEADPRVIGLDARFFTSKEPGTDSILAAAVDDARERLVLGSFLSSRDPKTGQFEERLMPIPLLRDRAKHFGYLNTVTEANSFRTVRSFSPSEPYKEDTVLSFPTQLARLYDSTAVNKLLQRGNATEFIHYIGNVYMKPKITTSDSFLIKNRAPIRFMFLDQEQILEAEALPMLTDKIVIMGFVDIYGSDWTDAFFTPMNPIYAGKTFPDMYGAVIHANVVSQILRGEYIDAMGPSGAILLAVIVAWLNAVVFTYIYYERGRWFDILLRSAQVGQALLALFLTILIFDAFHYKVDISYLLVVLLLGGDVLEIYLGFSGKIPYRKWIGLERGGGTTG